MVRMAMEAAAAAAGTRRRAGAPARRRELGGAAHLARLLKAMLVLLKLGQRLGHPAHELLQLGWVDVRPVGAHRWAPLRHRAADLRVHHALAFVW